MRTARVRQLPLEKLWMQIFRTETENNSPTQSLSLQASYGSFVTLMEVEGITSNHQQCLATLEKCALQH